MLEKVTTVKRITDDKVLFCFCFRVYLNFADLFRKKRQGRA